MRKLTLGVLLGGLIGLTACSDDDNGITVYYEEVSGYYVLSEGFMGGTGSLAWYDMETEELKTDYFETQNPGMTIGDTPNDVKIYGSKMYVTVWGEGQVLVLNAADAKWVKTIPVAGARGMATHGGNVYVTSYAGEVARIDTVSLQVTAKAPVTGARCEGITVHKNKLYVANSAQPTGETATGTTVSVIDITTFQEEDQIVTALNPTNLVTADNGYIYLTTLDAYDPVTYALLETGRVHRINPETKVVDWTFGDFAAGSLAYADSYAYTTHYDWFTGEKVFKQIDTRNNNVSDFNPSAPALNAVAANPLTGYVYGLADSYAPGASEVNLVSYDKNGTVQYTLSDVGLQPRAVAFLTRTIVKHE